MHIEYIVLLANRPVLGWVWVYGCADVLIQSALNRIIQSNQSLCQRQSKSHTVLALAAGIHSYSLNESLGTSQTHSDTYQHRMRK